MAVFLKTKRDKDMVMFNNNKYNFGSNNVNTCEIRWRCIKRSCSATLYTFGSKVVNEENILISDQDRHNHIPCNDSDINRQMVSTTCKRKALEELFMQPKKIILKELAQNSLLADGLTSNDCNTIRKVIYRSRRKVIPVLPSNIIEAHMALNTSETVTSKNEPFVCFNK